MNTNRIQLTVPATLAVVCLALLAAAPATAQYEEESYGYFRTVEGRASLTTLDEGDPIDVEINYPVLPGDRVWVTEGSRVEMQLPDRSVIRADGGTDLFLETLALSTGGEEGASTVIRLLSGEIQFIYADYATNLEPPRIDTGATTVYLQAPGNYRVLADEDRWTEVVVRTGFAELTTDRGSAVLRSGEELFVEYGRSPAAVRVAGGLDNLEHWGAELEGYAVADDTTQYVDESLQYAARPLRDNGDWVAVGSSYAWRPAVRPGWRPYTAGRWIYTPRGLTWVSFEPWGWLTSHYGTWDYAGHYGWVWHPGRIYSPAWVYWYWGPTHVAWVPAGFYTNFYGPRWGLGFDFRHGVYGWAGGYWDPWSRWTFCPTRYFGRRNYRAYWSSGEELARRGSYRAVPRGLVTNDTRSLRPEHWGKPGEALRVLKENHVRRAELSGSGVKELPDVTSFVARIPNLSDDARRGVLRSGKPLGSGGTVDPGKLSAGVAGRSGALTRGESGPWRIEKPLADTQGRSARTLSADRVTIDRRRDSASDTGSRSILRRETPLSAKPGTRIVVPERDSRVGGEGERRVSGPPATTGRKPLPPSARSGGGAVGRETPTKPVAREMPPVRRILDGVRSGTSRSPKEVEKPTASKPATSAPRESPPSTSGSTVRKPTSSSSSSARSSSTRKPPPKSSAQKPPSRSSSARSKSTASRSGSRGKAAKPRPKPKPKP